MCAERDCRQAQEKEIAMDEAQPDIRELLNDADRLLWGSQRPSQQDQGIAIGNAILGSALLLSDRIERLEQAVRESGLERADGRRPARDRLVTRFRL
jgi:hypothetical protein